VEVRTPRSVLYDGGLYGRLVEPMLSGVHGFVADRLPEGARVLDACCGTGGLAMRLAGAGREVTGVDLSPRNIAFAQGRAEATDLPVRFEVADVAAFEPPEGRFDVASVVLAIHEMPARFRRPLLANLVRIATRVMLVDFAAPMRWNVAGAFNRMVEMAAGREHFGNFRDFSRRGGLAPLVEELGLEVEMSRTINAGTMQIYVVSAPTDGSS